MDRSPPGIAFRLVTALSPRMSESQCFGAHRQTVAAPEWARPRGHGRRTTVLLVCATGFSEDSLSVTCMSGLQDPPHTPSTSLRAEARRSFSFRALRDSDTEVERLNSQEDGLK